MWAESNYHAGRAYSSAPATSRLRPTTHIDQAVEACCASLDRPFGAAEDALIELLRSNWYLTAADAAAMSEVRRAQLPLCSCMHACMHKTQSGAVLHLRAKL